MWKCFCETGGPIHAEIVSFLLKKKSEVNCAGMYRERMKNMAENPVKIIDLEGNQVTETLPDPFVLKYCGQYYVYCTSKNGIKVLHSCDLFQFTYLGYALSDTGEMEFWAPCVVYFNGLFYMYYSSRRKAEEDVHKQRLKVAVSNSPTGPFDFKTILKDTFCIDADVKVQLGQKWKIWYATNDFGQNRNVFAGTSIAEDTLETPFSLTGWAREAIAPSEERELFQKDRFGDGRDWYTVEAPCYYCDGKNDYLMYSGNAYTSGQYFTDYAVLNGGKWKKKAGNHRPLLSGSPGLIGTGHNSVFMGPNLLDVCVSFHGMRALPSREGEETREMCISKLKTIENKLTVSPRIAYLPSKPDCLCLIKEDDFDPSGWDSLSGRWEQSGVELLQASKTQNAALLGKEVFNSFVAEVSTKLQCYSGCGCAGFYVCYSDRKNYVIVLTDQRNKCIQIKKVQAGSISIQRLWTPQVDFMEFQTLRIQKKGREISVWLSGCCIGWTETSLLSGRVGLCTEGTVAAFAGLAVQKLPQ